MIFNQLQTSFRDSLSGLYSEDYFAEVFQREWHRMMRERDALSVIIIHPHLNPRKEEDKLAFRLVSDAVKYSTKRATDLVCRFQENEIAIGVFNLDEEGTETIITRILEDAEIALSNLPFSSDLSIGALNILPNSDIDPEEVFRMTEQLADEAEQKGKNAYRLKYFKLH